MTKRIGRVVVVVVAATFAASLFAGCASTKVVPVHGYIRDLPLSRPDVVLVYDLAVHPADISIDSALGKKARRSVSGSSVKDERQKVARKVVDAFSEKLVASVRKLGMMARRAAESPPGISENAILVKGRFVRVDEGSRTKRMVFGFGAGRSELKALVRVYQTTEFGPRLLQEFETSARGSRKPGMAVPMGAGAVAGSVATSAAISGGTGVISEKVGGVAADARRTAGKIAQELARLFARQGWIPVEMAK